MNDQDSKQVADTAIERMDVFFSKTLPRVIGKAIETAINESRYEISQAVENGFKHALGTNHGIQSELRTGFERAIKEGLKESLPNADVRRDDGKGLPT